MVLPQATVMIIGSLNMDSIYQIPSHIRPHDHIKPKGITMSGGHGGNQAVACRRMSRYKPVERRASIGIHGRHGRDDKDGLRIKEDLKRNGVNIDKVKATDKESTGTAHITVDRSGEAIVISDSKANDKVTPDIIPDLSPPLDLLLLQLEIPIETVQRAIQLARDQQPPIPVILNAAPAPDPSTQIPRDLY
ncbi:Ribokinase-like protein [Acephala macrosclerotiorum]|nr:Ribokinase-like protein [Acephala macrosclerotiorum]